MDKERIFIVVLAVLMLLCTGITAWWMDKRSSEYNDTDYTSVWDPPKGGWSSVQVWNGEDLWVYSAVEFGQSISEDSQKWMLIYDPKKNTLMVLKVGAFKLIKRRD